MKRILFHNSNSLILVILITFWFTNCKKQNNEIIKQQQESFTAKAGGNPNSLQAISLRVTINNVVGYNITSDGKGDYINGMDYVEAVLDQFGTFAFNTLNVQNPNTIAKRWIVYNFNNPVDPNNSYRPSPDNLHNYHFSTGGGVTGTSPFIPIQNLGVNGNPTTECIYMGNSVENGTIKWRVSFHKGNEDNAGSPTALAFVTRINSTQWTITPIGTCSPNSNVAALRNDDGSFFTDIITCLFSLHLLKYKGSFVI